MTLKYAHLSTLWKHLVHTIDFTVWIFIHTVKSLIWYIKNMIRIELWCYHYSFVKRTNCSEHKQANTLVNVNSGSFFSIFSTCNTLLWKYLKNFGSLHASQCLISLPMLFLIILEYKLSFVNIGHFCMISEVCKLGCTEYESDKVNCNGYKVILLHWKPKRTNNINKNITILLS
jgi:hypothetical protein